MASAFLKVIGVSLALGLPSAAAAADGTAPFAVEVAAQPIERFRIGSDETRFGALEFVGGFEMASPDRRFGQISAIRFLEPGGRFVGVADHGYWLSGAVMRDDAGLPVGIGRFTMQAMVDEAGRPIADKVDKDAEGLDVRDGVATVSFERRARISEFRLEPDGMGPPLRDLDIVIPRNELRSNQGIETVVRAHPNGIHEGARIAIAERSIDTDGNIFAAILEGAGKGVFKVRRTDDFDVTDGVFLEDGNLLLLERRFSALRGVAMRLRLIQGETVRKGAIADGPVLMEADLGYRIDNMEAIDVWKRGDGETMVSLMSDDNQSFLQRSLYLEFRLAE